MDSTRNDLVAVLNSLCAGKDLKWQGYACSCPFCADKGRSGYVLIFRELNDQPKWSEALPMVARGRLECETLAGKGSVRISAGRLTAALGDAKSFLLARFEKR